MALTCVESAVTEDEWQTTGRSVTHSIDRPTRPPAIWMGSRDVRWNCMIDSSRAGETVFFMLANTVPCCDIGRYYALYSDAVQWRAGAAHIKEERYNSKLVMQSDEQFGRYGYTSMGCGS